MSQDDDLESRVDNTLAILGAAFGTDPHALKRALALAAETLKAVREALRKRAAELDVLTTPGRKPAQELLRLEKDLQSAVAKSAAHEQRSVMLGQELQLERELHAAAKKRLAEAEKQAVQYEAMLLKDDAAFSKYLDRALDADEKKRGRRPPPVDPRR